MTNRLQIRLRDDFGFDGFELFIRNTARCEEPEMINVLTDMTFTRVSCYEARPNNSPLLLLERNYAKMLMDDLWNCGVRPSNFRGDGSAEIAAYKAHITHLENTLKKMMEWHERVLER